MNGESVLDMEDKAGVGGGVKDVYGEDRASEDQFITPWTVSVASGYTLLRDPHHNKGLAFTDKERDAHYLTGLLPPVVFTQELQDIIPGPNEMTPEAMEKKEMLKKEMQKLLNVLCDREQNVSRLHYGLNGCTTSAASFRASAIAKISVDACLTGAIIGKAGVNCHLQN